METSGYTDAKTPGRSRREHDQIWTAYEERAAGGRVAYVGTPVVGVYERFLELPVWAVLAAMWVAGAALLGSCALTLYLLGSLLLQILN